MYLFVQETSQLNQRQCLHQLSVLKILSDTKTLIKSSHRSCFMKKIVPKTFGIVTEKHPCWSLCRPSGLLQDLSFTCTYKILFLFGQIKL